MERSRQEAPQAALETSIAGAAHAHGSGIRKGVQRSDTTGLPSATAPHAACGGQRLMRRVFGWNRSTSKTGWICPLPTTSRRWRDSVGGLGFREQQGAIGMDRARAGMAVLARHMSPPSSTAPAAYSR
jgi:hypothetical protein